MLSKKIKVIYVWLCTHVYVCIRICVCVVQSWEQIYYAIELLPEMSKRRYRYLIKCRHTDYLNDMETRVHCQLLQIYFDKTFVYDTYIFRVHVNMYIGELYKDSVDMLEFIIFTMS